MKNSAPVIAAFAALLAAVRPTSACGWTSDGQPLPTGAVARIGIGPTAHSGPVYWVAWSPDGKTLATTGKDGIRLWNSRTGAALAYVPADTSVMVSGPLSPDGKVLAAGCIRGVVRLVDPLTGGELRRITIPGNGYVAGLDFSPDGRLLASSRWPKASVILSDLENGETLDSFCGHTAAVISVAFSPNGRLLASSGNDATVRLWDPAAIEPPRILAGHSSGVTRIAFSPDGCLLASASNDRTVRIWEVATGQTVLEIRGHRQVVAAVRFSPDGSMLVSGSADGTIRIWDALTGRELLQRTGHQGRVNFVAYSLDGRSLASSGEDTAVYIWDVGAVRPLAAADGRTKEDLERLWTDLISEDAAAAYRAMAGLADSPTKAVELLGRRLQPVVPTPEQSVLGMLPGLDDPSFPVREAASQKLVALGAATEPAVRRILSGNPSAEVRSRLEHVLRCWDAPAAASGEALRAERVIRTLERIGTAEARKVLERLAAGASGAQQTRQANEALVRLKRRPSPLASNSHRGN